MKTPTKRTAHRLAAVLAIATAFATTGAWADLYWVAQDGTGTWGGNNWSSSASGTGGAWASGTTALFAQSPNNIDLNGSSFTIWTLRPKSGEYSSDNRCKVNIYNTSETESTLTFKDFGDNAEDLRNMEVTFGGSESTGKVKVFGDANNNNARYAFIVDRDSHLVFAANSEYTESNAQNSYIGKNAGSANSVTVENGASVKLNGDLSIAYSGNTGTLTVNGGTFEVDGGKWLRLYAKGVINLNGGTFKTKHIEPQSGAVVNFNGGTLIANAVSGDGLIGTGVTVKFGERGGTIDNGGFAVTIKPDMGNSGTVRFTGSGTTTLTGDNLYGNDTVVNGGNVIVSGRDTEITKSLTVNVGTFESDVDKWTKLSGGTINLNGGTFKTRHIHRQSGSPIINFNGGTLQATRDYADNGGLIQSGVTVNVNGGTIDCGEYAIVVGAALGGTGGLTFTGGNAITLNGNVNYSGATAVTPGTILAIENSTAKANIFNNGLVVAGLPTADQTVVTSTSAFDDTDLAKVSCSLAPTTTFKFTDETKTAIAVDTPGPALDNCWTGAANDGDLSNADNWSSGTVPTTGNANIFSTAPVTLTKGATFAPTSITFLEGSASVTINGGELSNIAKIENRSSVRHVFNCAVSGNEIDFRNTAHCCEFRGGISVETPVFDNSPANASARAIVGDWIITGGWSPVSYNELGRDDATGSSITVQGELLNPNNLVIYSGSVVTAATMKATSSTYPAYTNNGRLVIAGMVDIANTSGDFYLARQDGENATIIAGGIVYNTGKWPWLNAKTLVLGEDGINFDSSHNNNLRFGATPTLYARGAATTLHAGKDDRQAYTINNGKTLTVCTTQFDSSEPSTITIDGKIVGKYDNNHTGGMAVTGCGTLVFNSASTFTGGLTVGDTATVQVNARCTPGTGSVTLGGGTTFAFQNSGSSLTLPAPIALPSTGAATLRIGGDRLRSGKHTIATGVAADAADHLVVDPASAALAGRKMTLAVEDGNLVLDIPYTGLMVIFR